MSAKDKFLDVLAEKAALRFLALIRSRYLRGFLVGISAASCVWLFIYVADGKPLRQISVSFFPFVISHIEAREFIDRIAILEVDLERLDIIKESLEEENRKLDKFSQQYYRNWEFCSDTQTAKETNNILILRNTRENCISSNRQNEFRIQQKYTIIHFQIKEKCLEPELESDSACQFILTRLEFLDHP
ncbi:hypothetical protein [Parasedimentitalea psychrophila]|uniref:Uncharacterized protein n=1 Tax=Parasedimentitalea psychrophila TaxID=2997337 RepID=A0A9Y2KYU1_9RHOB|nr:hypothetical protein [Parasedimentitalea psychrophila]WIY24531.1 hypothetical protein QPJ95_18610 [Parasedimentitalea psychrophila]